ncbi:MAG: ABC transporter substrate-binding protein [Pseudomonadota bacterium]
MSEVLIMTSKRILAGLYLLLGISAGVSAQELDRVTAVEAALQAQTPEAAVEGATVHVLDLISAGQEYAADEPERFYREVEALIDPMLDFKRFARNVMGPAYKKATPEQRERFSEVFRWSLVRTYALALTEFRDGEVDVLAPRRPHRDANKAKVIQEITYKGRTYTAIYMMQRGKTSNWRVQNIIIEGVNIGVNFRTQFSAALRSKENGGDIDKVIDSWGNVIESSDA